LHVFTILGATVSSAMFMHVARLAVGSAAPVQCKAGTRTVEVADMGKRSQHGLGGS